MDLELAQKLLQFILERGGVFYSDIKSSEQFAHEDKRKLWGVLQSLTLFSKDLQVKKEKVGNDWIFLPIKEAVDGQSHLATLVIPQLRPALTFDFDVDIQAMSQVVEIRDMRQIDDIYTATLQTPPVVIDGAYGFEYRAGSATIKNRLGGPISLIIVTVEEDKAITPSTGTRYLDGPKTLTFYPKEGEDLVVNGNAVESYQMHLKDGVRAYFSGVPRQANLVADTFNVSVAGHPIVIPVTDILVSYERNPRFSEGDSFRLFFFWPLDITFFGRGGDVYGEEVDFIHFGLVIPLSQLRALPVWLQQEIEKFAQARNLTLDEPKCVILRITLRGGDFLSIAPASQF